MSSRWTVCFTASAKVNVEAQTEEQARAAAEKTLKAIGVQRLRFDEVAHCSVDVSVTQED